MNQLQEKEMRLFELAGQLVTAETERQSIFNELQSVRDRIWELKASKMQSSQAELRNAAIALESAKKKLIEAKRNLAEKKADYERLQRESSEMTANMEQQRIETENLTVDQDDQIMQIRELKRKIEMIKPRHASMNDNVEDEDMEEKRKMAKMEAGLELAGLESRAKTLEGKIEEVQDERKQMEEEIHKFEQSIQVVMNRNNAMSLRMDAQIAEAQRRQQYVRAKTGAIAQEINALKGEIRRYTVPATPLSVARSQYF